jgi:NAD(P)-dependent dehydrogenase (short-subunit alcohol dehydrogenase family)
MADSPTLTDPRTRFAQPPFEDQDQIDPPGLSGQMTPRPDHGESSYVGADRLRGLAAIVTGGDSGIGRAVCIALAREGADVMIACLNEEGDAQETRDLVEAEGVRAAVFAGDLKDESACEELVKTAVGELGRLDLLINNAAHQRTRPHLEDMDSGMFDAVFKTNVYAPFWLAKAALPHLQPGASIINTVSIQGYDPTDMLLPYATSKSALIGMTKAMAKLVMQHGVRVNAVAPGPVWTPLIPATMPGEAVEGFGGSTSFGRPAMPAELAPLYVWLASDDASYVTGEVYGATGGKSPL